MPSAERLQKGQSSFRILKRKKGVSCSHTVLPSKSLPSARLAKAGPGSPRLTAAWSWTPQVRHAALMTETGRDNPAEGVSWHNTQRCCGSPATGGHGC